MLGLLLSAGQNNMPIVYVSIGSNIERDKNIASSLSALEKQFGQLTLSSVYDTEAVGFSGEAFYNLVVGFESNHPVTVIANTLRAIELAHGRSREAQKFSARTLDLDLILYGNLVFNEGRLHIPRADIERYAFVLEPLAEIAPEMIHPVLGKSYALLWQEFDKSPLKQRRVKPAWLSTK